MTLEEKIEAQKKMNKLAEGYKYTIILQRQALKKYILLLNDKDINRAEIMNKIALSKTVIKECSEIFKYLTNYYHIPPANANSEKKQNKATTYAMQNIIEMYKKGCFDININNV